MSDRRQFNGHRIAKREFQGHRPSDALRRAMRNEQPWPNATVHTPPPQSPPQAKAEEVLRG